MSRLIPTDEQQQIIDAVPTHDRIKINAFAGASKTTTLVMVAEANVVPSLYITFNKLMADDAKGKFPSHVEVRTSHSLAFRHVGVKYSHKLTRPEGPYKNVCGTGKEVARYFKLSPYRAGTKTLSAAVMGYSVLDTVTRFEHSADEELSEKHVVINGIEKLVKQPGFRYKDIQKIVLDAAKKLWQLRIDASNEILCTHDTYLKLYQLSKPVLDKYQILYLDEMQDANPCLLDIVKNQNCKVVLVGDQYQAIYQFRNAINALGQVDWPEFQLTKSFRFGQDVADVASMLLDMSPGTIGGNETVTTTIMADDPEFPYTKVYRTNSALILDAVDYLERGITVNLNVDVKGFISILQSCIALKAEDHANVRHRDIQLFDNWAELVEIATAIQDPELTRIIKLIEGNQADKVLKILTEYRPAINPEVELISAHKSKGLERARVVLAEDFQVPEPDKEGNIQLVDAERNLVYVAFTRAIAQIKPNALVNAMLTNYLSNTN